MVDFFALLGNPQLWYEFPHVLFGALLTGSFFVAGISAFKLLRKQQVHLFKSSFQIAIVVGLVSSILVALAGHSQAQHLMETQPMKMAASEAQWETSGESAPWTLFAVIDTDEHKNSGALEIPHLFSILAYNKINGVVPGIHQLQAEYEAKYGPGNYIPPVKTTFWSFRIMVFAGGIMILMALYGTIMTMRNKLEGRRIFLKMMPWAIALPYIANTTGWIMTEVGRQPWIVFGLQKTPDGVSPTVSTGMVWSSFLGFTLVYGILAIVLVYLFIISIRKGPDMGGHGDSSAREPMLYDNQDGKGAEVHA